MKNQHIIPSIHSPFIYFASLFSFLYLQSSLLSLYTSLAVPPPIPLPTTSLYLFSVSLQRVRVVDLEEGDLQDVWLLVNQEVLKRILRVLPERHPSYKYTSDLEDLFRKIQQVFPPQSDEVCKTGHRVTVTALLISLWTNLTHNGHVLYVYLSERAPRANRGDLQ